MTGPEDVPTPDAARLAWPAEAAQIAALQRRGWQQTLPSDTFAALTSGLSVEAMAQAWRQALERPPGAAYRVLVEVEQQRVVGFASLGPSSDADTDVSRDGEVEQFVIDPAAQHRGHGSRLLNAVGDTLRADGFGRAVWWVGTTDEPLRRFLVEAGWAPDGAAREIGAEDDSGRLRQVRLHTLLS